MKQRYDLEWLKVKLDQGEYVKYMFFWGHNSKEGQGIDHSCFSQWYERPFIVDDILYRTSEHWMMAKKALLFNNHSLFEKILNCPSPGAAKDLGRNVVGFDEKVWTEKRCEIVCQGNIHKFEQNPELKTYLLKTTNRVLVEASPLDSIWGVGLSKDDELINNPYNWKGENLLGFTLMQVRDELNN